MCLKTIVKKPKAPKTCPGGRKLIFAKNGFAFCAEAPKKGAKPKVERKNQKRESGVTG